MQIIQRVFCLLLLVSLVVCLSGCDKASEAGRHRGETLVRIQASLSVPGLRADPVIGQDIGTEIERYVGSIRVMAFRGELLIKNQMYRVSDATLLAGERAFAYKNGDPTTMQMDLDLPAGDYEFILVANEDPDLAAPLNLQLVTNKAELVNGLLGREINTINILNPLTTQALLNTKIQTKKVGLMMVGHQSYRVAPHGTVGSPVILNPVILMKRVLSKVELSLKNTQTDGTLYPNSKYTSIKRAELIRGNEVYHIFEENKSTINQEQYLASGGSFPTSFNIDITHNRGDIFGEQVVLSCYLAERNNVTSEAQATALKIVVDNDGIEREYSIPLYSMNGASKDYNIYRNTIYRVNATLVGSEIKFDTGILVSPWIEKVSNVTVNEGDLL